MLFSASLITLSVYNGREQRHFTLFCSNFISYKISIHPKIGEFLLINIYFVGVLEMRTTVQIACPNNITELRYAVFQFIIRKLSANALISTLDTNLMKTGFKVQSCYQK